jgi:hypothetical protein
LKPDIAARWSCATTFLVCSTKNGETPATI